MSTQELRERPRAHPLASVPVPEPAGKLLAYFKVDLPGTPDLPSPLRLALATVVALVGALVVDALIVKVGTSIFPSTKGYGHFHFGDYATLTVIGVLIACVGWPITTWISSAPRWLFLRMAVVVTFVLFLPDVWLLVQGSSAKAVLVLIVMHVGIAVVTYQALVRIAPPDETR